MVHKRENIAQSTKKQEAVESHNWSHPESDIACGKTI